MKRKLEVEIILEKGETINTNKIKVELIKLGIKPELIQKSENICLIEFKTFEISFDLAIVDLICYILLKSKLKNVEKVNYKLEYYDDYNHILHYFLLDFELQESEKQHISQLFNKIINTPIYLNKELFQEGKIRLKNKNIINLESLRKIFFLDKKMLYINNCALKEKLMRFILDTRSKVGSYIFI
ncbi:MAG: hypothetical protein PHI37_03640 [Candidatus Gracilibacteria bacterium]|nr:hypothetical protein [Candidatus Gracilibacteria bacterium]